MNLKFQVPMSLKIVKLRPENVKKMCMMNLLSVAQKNEY